MLIQNINNTPQAQLPARIAGDRPAGVGVPRAAAASNIEAMPDVAVGLPENSGQQAIVNPPSNAQLQNMVENINKALKQSNRNLEFTVDSDTMKSIIKLVDTETGEVIRQFPSDEALAITRAIDRIRQGLLLKQKA